MLIRCTECNSFVSKDAKECPKCGCPISIIIENLEKNRVEKENSENVNQNKNIRIKCKECGSYIEEGLKECPECGCPDPTIKLEEPRIVIEPNKNNNHKNKWTKVIIGVIVSVILLIIIGTFAENADVSSVKSGRLHVEPDYTMEEYFDNYYGYGGTWDSPYDGYVEYTSPDENTKVGFDVNEDGIFEISNVYYTNGTYLTSDWDLAKYMVETFGYTSARIRNEYGSTVNSMEKLDQFINGISNFYDLYN